MSIRSVSDIKRSQKESLLLRTISQLFHQAARDDSKLTAASITRVQLSPNKSLCTVYFYMPEGKEAFKKLLPSLTLYKPSLRKALSQEIRGRYTCELVFRFDEQFEKVEKIEKLLNSLAETDDSSQE